MQFEIYYLTYRLSSLLAMRICGFSLLLVKRVQEKPAKLLAADTRRIKKSTVDLTLGDPDPEDGSDNESNRDKGDALQNAKQQVAALMHFKEAFCTGERPPERDDDSC